MLGGESKPRPYGRLTRCPAAPRVPLGPPPPLLGYKTKSYVACGLWLMLDGRSSWHGGVAWGGDGARWGARRWPVSAWWAGAGGQSSDDSHGTL